MLNLEDNSLSGIVIGAAIEVHRHLGPGLLESAYEECLTYELQLRGIEFIRQNSLPVTYKVVHLDCGYRLDVFFPGQLIVEIKAVDALHPIHTAQLMTYLKLSGTRLGLLLNFNTVVLKDGIKRVVCGYGNE